MTNEERIAAQAHAAGMVATYLRDELQALHEELNFPWEIILAGAHAEVVAAMMRHLGGPVAAEACTLAAARALEQPADAETSLAFAAPAGWA